MSKYGAGYVNNNIMDDFSDILKKFYNSLKDKSAKLDEMSFEEFISRYSKDIEFLNYLKYVKSSLNEISDIMEQINFRHDEYYNFSSIKRMITYIVNDFEKYFHHHFFIMTLLRNFLDLIIKERQLEDYCEEYEKFDCLLYKQEDYFYTEIFDYESKYNHAIVKLTNVLG